MSRTDLFFLAAYGGMVGMIVGLVFTGPLFGPKEFIATLLASIAAWYFGTAAVCHQSGTAVELSEAFRRKMWRFVALSAALLVALYSVYLWAEVGRQTSYPTPWWLIYFLFVLIGDVLARIMTFSAKRAVESSSLEAKAAGEKPAMKDGAAKSGDISEG